MYATMKQYRSIKVPKGLADNIEKIIEENPRFGFVSIADFIKHASRELMFRFEEK